MIALGLLFAPFTYKIDRLHRCRRRRDRRAALRDQAPDADLRAPDRRHPHQVIMVVLLGLGALAYWAGSEAVLPAYIVGIVLAGGPPRTTTGSGACARLTVGFLTPFYFLRAGMLVSVSAVVAAPVVVLVLFAAKVGAKIFGLYPVVGRFRTERKERWYYTLMMSTGLTFGTISALYGLSHGIVTQDQYSYLVAVVIGTAVIPTLVASLAFVPRHLLPKAQAEPVPQLPRHQARSQGRPLSARRSCGRCSMSRRRLSTGATGGGVDELDLEQEEAEDVADEG